MKTDETRRACNCQQCHGTRRLNVLTMVAQSEEEQGQLEAISAALNHGQVLHTAQDVQHAIARANWELDFVHFCRLLGLRENETDEHSREMWSAFLRLVGAVGKFDNNNLAKLIEFGLSLKVADGNGQLVISIK
jgi:hypothetical protein